MHARRLAPFLAVALALALAPEGLAQEQDDPAPKPQDEGAPQDDGAKRPRRTKKQREEERQREREKREKQREKQNEAKKPAGEPAKLVPCPALGGTIDTIRFFDVAATEDGRRTELDEIPPGTAFEVWVEGRLPRKVYVEEPAPDEPGGTRQVPKSVVSLLRVSDAEWGEYVGFLQHDLSLMAGSEATFLTAVATVMLQQKGTLLYYRDELPAIEKRAEPVLEKLRQGVPFDQVVRVHSEDEISRNGGGLIVDDTRGGVLGSYPFSKALFSMQPGEACGPIYNRTAAYIVHVDRVTPDPNPRFTRVRASAVTFKYTAGTQASAKDLGLVLDAVRVRTNQERFLKLLPPGIQVPSPKSFGPEDAAPHGKPDTPLRSAFDGSP